MAASSQAIMAPSPSPDFKRKLPATPCDPATALNPTKRTEESSFRHLCRDSCFEPYAHEGGAACDPTLLDPGSLRADQDSRRFYDGFHRRKSDSRAARKVLRTRMNVRLTRYPPWKCAAWKGYQHDGLKGGGPPN
jgi:hypothetical protein